MASFSSIFRNRPMAVATKQTGGASGKPLAINKAESTCLVLLNRSKIVSLRFNILIL